jgi:hypothetical protein
MRSFLLRVIAAGCVASMAAGWLAVGAADAYATIGVCQQDLQKDKIDCSFSNPDGIKGVFISLNAPSGIKLVVDDTYDCETPVLVEWKDLRPTHDFEVEACPLDPAVPEPGLLPLAPPSEPREPIEDFELEVQVPAQKVDPRLLVVADQQDF